MSIQRGSPHRPRTRAWAKQEEAESIVPQGVAARRSLRLRGAGLDALKHQQTLIQASSREAQGEGKRDLKPKRVPSARIGTGKPCSKVGLKKIKKPQQVPPGNQKAST